MAKTAGADVSTCSRRVTLLDTSVSVDDAVRQFTCRDRKRYYLRPKLIASKGIPELNLMTDAVLIDGKAKAAELSTSISAATAMLVEQKGIKPGLTVIIVGEDPASQVYVRNKKRTAEACGFASVQHNLADDTSQEDILALIDTLNSDATVHGILVQLPLPANIDEQVVTQAISPVKDVDGFHFQNIGMLTAAIPMTHLFPARPQDAC